VQFEISRTGGEFVPGRGAQPPPTWDRLRNGWHVGGGALDHRLGRRTGREKMKGDLMKRQPKKLVLAKETLIALLTEDLRSVRGGIYSRDCYSFGEIVPYESYCAC